MKEFEAIKKYFRPIQPAITIEKDNGDIIYREIYPEGKVAHFIYCFWQLKTKTPLSSPYIYRVVSDGCIDIFFNHYNAEESFVMGFCRKYTEFGIGKAFDYLGIRFLPSAFPLLFGVDAKSLSNQSQELNKILPKTAEFISKNIHQHQDFEVISKTLHAFIEAEIANRNFDFDGRFFKALKLIFEKSGTLETEQELNTGLSPRQLRRIFNYYIGTTPKSFSKVVRFQCILNAKPSIRSLKNNKLFYDVGFYDQAHFIKDFKTFYGVTPMQAFH